MPEFHIHEVVANIELLEEFKDGGLEPNGELVRLKEMGMDYEALVELADVSDWSPSGLDLLHVSEDSVTQSPIPQSMVAWLVTKLVLAYKASFCFFCSSFPDRILLFPSFDIVFFLSG